DRVHHRGPVLQGTVQHRHSHRPDLVGRRHPARLGHVRERDRVRLATGQLRKPGLRPGEHHLRHLVLRSERRVRAHEQLPHPPAGAGTGVLKALQSGGANAPNGLYHYGTSGGFPTDSYLSTNYWVDAVFSNTFVDQTPPTVTAKSPAAGSTGVSTSSAVTATFSESVQAATISFALKDASNNVVPSATAYVDSNQTVTLTPNALLAQSTTYTATLTGAKDLAGNLMAPVTWSFTTAGQVTNATVWGPTVTPANPSATDTAAIELGVKFTSSQAGYITGIRFYKGTANTGTHVGHLWTAAGTQLATATFGGESASGWQQANFSNPVAIAANTTYVVSYYAPSGGYSYDPGYFAGSGFTNAPLTVLSNADAGGNGLYRYGTGGGFPTSSYNSTNYWVDVVFSESVGDSTPPTVSTKTPAASATGVDPAANVTATFSEGVQANTIVFQLKDAANNPVPASVRYDSATDKVTVDPAPDVTPVTR